MCAWRSLGTIGSISATRAAIIARIRQLEQSLDEGLVQRMIKTAKELRPLVKRDASMGVTELEFALGMLVELRMVDFDQVRPFIKQFRTLVRCRG